MIIRMMADALLLLLPLLLLVFGADAARTPAQYSQDQVDFINAVPLREAQTFPLFQTTDGFKHHTTALFGHNKQDLSDSMLRAFQALPALAGQITGDDFREAMRHVNCLPLVLYCLSTGRPEFYHLFTDPVVALQSWLVLGSPTYSRFYPSDAFLGQIQPAALKGLDPKQWDRLFGGKLTSNHLSDAAFTELLKHPKACKYYARNLGSQPLSYLNKLPNKIHILSTHCPTTIFGNLNPAVWTGAQRLFKDLTFEAMRAHLADHNRCGVYTDQIINEIPLKDGPISKVLSVQCILKLDMRANTKHSAERIQTLPLDYLEHIHPNSFNETGTINYTFLLSLSPEQLFVSLRRGFLANPEIAQMTTEQLDQLVVLVAKRGHCRLLSEPFLERASPKVYHHLDVPCWTKLDPKLKLRLTSAQLVYLPSRAWNDIHGNILADIKITESDGVSLEELKIRTLLSKLGSATNPTHREAQHGCYNPVGLFKAMPAPAMASITDGCMKHTQPSAIAVLKPDQLNSLPISTVRALTSSQVSAIPTEHFADLTDEFLMDGLVKGTEHSKVQSKRLACSGFQLEQLLSITSIRFWSELSGTCVLHWSNSIWKGLPEDQLRRAPPAIFKRWLMPPNDADYGGAEVIADLMEKITPDQLAVLGDSLGPHISKRRHPCWNVEFDWKSLGGPAEHLEAMKRLPSTCFSLLNPAVIEGMEEGDFGLLADDILAEMDDPARFAMIPVAALKGIRAAQLEHLSPILCSALDESRLLVFSEMGLTEHLDSGCLYRIKPELLPVLFKMPLSEGALVDLDRDSLRDLSFLQTIDGDGWKSQVVVEVDQQPSAVVTKAESKMQSKEKVVKDDLRDEKSASKVKILDLSKTPPVISINQWSQLGMRDVREGILKIHPCEVIRKEHVVLPPQSSLQYYPPTLQAFWQGINPHCFASLLFLSELTERELALVPDSAFATLSDYQVAILKPILGPGAAEGRLEMARNCRKQTAEYVNGLTPMILATLSLECFSQWDPRMIGGLRGETLEALTDQFFAFLSIKQLAALNPDAMAKIRPEQWRLMGDSTNGISCSGFTTVQAAQLPTQWLPPLCTASLEPAVYGRLSIAQLNRLNGVALSRYISARHIAAVQPNVLGEFSRFSQLGTDWILTATTSKRSLKDHPCNGVTVEQQRAMNLQVRTDFERQCLPILAKIENVGSHFGIRTSWLWFVIYGLLMASVLLR